MKTQSTVKPDEKFIIEDIRNSKYLLYFNDLDNIEEKIVQDENKKNYTVYIYNTYSIKVWKRDNLRRDIESNYETWFNFAKQEEIDRLSKEIRQKRDELLRDSDKEMVLDRLKFNLPENITTTSLLQSVKDFFTSLKEIKSSDMAEYRQKLRDIPQQEGFPYDIVFPKNPNESGE